MPKEFISVTADIPESMDFQGRTLLEQFEQTYGASPHTEPAQIEPGNFKFEDKFELEDLATVDGLLVVSVQNRPNCTLLRAVDSTDYEDLFSGDHVPRIFLIPAQSWLLFVKMQNPNLKPDQVWVS